MVRTRPEREKSARGEIQPMNQKRIHGGGKPGRAAVTFAPESYGIPSLMGVIDPSTGSLVLFCLTKKAL